MSISEDAAAPPVRRRSERAGVQRVRSQVPGSVSPAPEVEFLVGRPVPSATLAPPTSAPRRGISAGVVLRTVLERGPIARSTIGRLVGLSAASVTGHTAELGALGLLRNLPHTAISTSAG